VKLFKCPHCGKDTISLAQKYRLGYWLTHICSNCSGRSSANPYLLAVLSLAYMWDVLWFTTMYLYTHKPMHLLYMVIGWLIIDAINIQFMPLSRLKKRVND